MSLNSCPNHTCCITPWAAHLRDKEQLCPTLQYLLQNNKPLLPFYGY